MPKVQKSTVALLTWALIASASTPDTQERFLPTVLNKAVQHGTAPQSMVWVPGGTFSMGNEDPRRMPAGGHESMADARPIHRVYVDGFWMDKTDVTNAEFARFIKSTGYITIAERKPRAQDFPQVPADKLVPGSIVFRPPHPPCGP